jgi:hypothetical protein
MQFRHFLNADGDFGKAPIVRRSAQRRRWHRSQ